MTDLARACCPNPQCPHHGKPGQGNISVRGRYGKDRDRPLLYCRTCGRRFSAARGTPLFGAHVSTESLIQLIRHSTAGLGIRAVSRATGLSTDTVSKALVKVGGHCLEVLDGMMETLRLPSGFEEELLDFVRARNLARKAAGARSVAVRNPSAGRPAPTGVTGKESASEAWTGPDGGRGAEPGEAPDRTAAEDPMLFTGQGPDSRGKAGRLPMPRPFRAPGPGRPSPTVTPYIGGDRRLFGPGRPPRQPGSRHGR
jgi:transposase-like protein